jgi:hypothetical protein
MITGGLQQIKDCAEIQASEVIKQIRSVGSYGSPTFDDPVTAYIMANRFDWGSLCRMNSREVHFFTKDFVRIYEVCSRNKKELMIEGRDERKRIDHKN